VFGVGYLTGIAIGVHALHKLWRIASGRITDGELIEIRESEEVPHGASEAKP
jgi:TRAP-type transport system small permease protein